MSGSSKQKTRALCTKAQAQASFCFMPLERFAPSSPRFSHRSSRFKTASARTISPSAP